MLAYAESGPAVSWSSTRTLETPQDAPLQIQGTLKLPSPPSLQIISSVLRADPPVTAHIFDEQDGLYAEGHATIEIVVSDTGCGIPPEKLESVSENSSK